MSEAHRPRVLIPVHSAKRAGAQAVALRQARAIARDYELVVAIGEGPLRADFGELATIVRAPSRLPIWGASPQRWLLDLARIAPDTLRFANLIRRMGIDAVLVPSTVMVAPVLAGRLAGIGVVVEAQEAPRSRAARALLRVHGALADRVIAISRELESALRGSRAKVVLSYVGVPVPPMPGLHRRVDDCPLRLLTVGTIDRHKRQDVAIAALAELAAQGVDAELELVGLESDRHFAAELREQVAAHGLQDRVLFAGETSDVQRRLQRADVLVVPGGEVTPLVLMEAMAQGTPVVAARVGAVEDVVGSGDRCGLLVPAGDPVATAAALRRLAELPKLANTLAVNARARVEERFDETASNERLRRVLADLLSESAAQKWGTPRTVVGA